MLCLFELRTLQVVGHSLFGFNSHDAHTKTDQPRHILLVSHCPMGFNHCNNFIFCTSCYMNIAAMKMVCISYCKKEMCRIDQAPLMLLKLFVYPPSQM